jgi:hypothetical protein
LEESLRLEIAEFCLCGGVGPLLAFGVVVARASLRFFSGCFFRLLLHLLHPDVFFRVGGGAFDVLAGVLRRLQLDRLEWRRGGRDGNCCDGIGLRGRWSRGRHLRMRCEVFQFKPEPN